MLSPDSDIVQWVVIIGGLIQTTAAVIQVRQGRRPNPDASGFAAQPPVFWMIVVTAFAGLLWNFGFIRMYQRRRTSSGTISYTVRDEFADLPVPPGALLSIGILVLCALAGATAVAFHRTPNSTPFSNTSMAVLMVSVAVAVITVLNAVVSTYRHDDDSVLLMFAATAMGAIGGWAMNVERRGG